MNMKRKKIIRIIGIVLIIAGILIISYPLYTNFIMKRQEADILSNWDSALALSTADIASTEATNGNQNLEQEILVVDPTKKIPFKITIPDIGSEWIVLEGTDVATLKKGPGHYIGTALPGEIGRCVIAGHRTTYGAPFNRANELDIGDEIIVETAGHEEYIYLVVKQEEVPPENVSVLNQTENATLALTTCTPKFYATRRLIIYAELEGSTETETKE